MSAASAPEWAMATLMFVDVRGFTAFADRATAREAVDYLTEFLEVAVPPVRAHDGEVNQLLGDGLLAIFTRGAHADAALACGREILTETDARLGDGCRVGVGINSGLILIGTISAGGLSRRTAVGDPINVAHRVQDATRELGDALLLTEATRALLDGDRSGLVSRGALALRGKSRPTSVYGLARESRNAAGTPEA
ncbi:MAG: adenylate/guanylate cyclase domain-containing protein [Solirubrobacterales bacterium]